MGRGWPAILWLFVVKQKTAYEMRIRDWSSDVCPSDLPGVDAQISGFDETFETGEAQPFYLHGMPPGSSSNRSWCNLGVTDPPCSRHAAWVGESQAHKPLPFRGGVGVGAIGLAQGRWPPPAATKPASWQVSLPSPEGEG